jgi:hypothetical protein
VRDVTAWPVPLQIEYFAARNVWPRRYQQPPSGDFVSWGAWYLFKFGRSIEEAAKEFAQR